MILDDDNKPVAELTYAQALREFKKYTKYNEFNEVHESVTTRLAQLIDKLEFGNSVDVNTSQETKDKIKIAGFKMKFMRNDQTIYLKDGTISEGSDGKGKGSGSSSSSKEIIRLRKPTINKNR